MGNRKRIALFAGQADESYQSRFISGFLKEAFAAGYDVCIFSMYRKYQDTPEREKGESNIFSLMNPDRFDSAVILKDSIQTENAAEQLERSIKDVFQKPIVVIEKDSELFPSICTDCYSAIFELIDHLIRVHGCKDIAFLTGKKWHKHSQERLQAYKDAMAGAGLEVSEERIIYGDFWYQSGEICAEDLMADGKKLPDAVACANDQMAIGLCKALTERGIRVPEDIAVVGYDSTFEGQTSPHPITSALIPAEEFGEYAFHFLTEMMNGKVPESFRLKSQMVIGESCGCKCSSMPSYQIRRDAWGTDISEERFDSVFNTLEEDLISQSSLQEYLDTAYSYVYQIVGAEEFHLCLSEEWKYMSRDVRFRNEGYAPKMIHAIRYCSDRKHNIAGLLESFDTADMLPELYDTSRETPTAYFFTPLFYENECFGYAVVSYGSQLLSYDSTYRRWISAVGRGLEYLRRTLVMKQMNELLERFHSSKFKVTSLAYESLNAEEKAQYELVARILDENLLDYHFQPIVSAVDGSVYAYEALMRSRTDTKVLPLSIIRYAAMQERLSDVERATFLNVLQFIDEHGDSFGGAKVFINSIPGVRTDEASLSELESRIAAHAEKVVVELTEESELKDSELKKLKAYFEKLHINIAVDDYGTGYSNVSNLLRYMPDFVKIDRSLLSDIHEYPQKQHFVREIIDFCHDNGIKALAEGIETTEELRMVIHLGVDLIQGFYTARPSATIVAQINEKCRSEIRQYHQERIDGNTKRIYNAGKTNRISLARLVKDGCTDIVVGREEMVYKDISIIGTPQMKTDIHIRIEPGYKGSITLEDVYFTNVNNRPAIELGENSCVTLVLVGSNTLYRAGIQVPESSKLIIEGLGTLLIDLDSAESYGIGNTHQSRHGEIVFEQDGMLKISCRGKSGICIGSGLGGIIRINRGEYNLNIDTEFAVGIGALKGDVDLAVTTCRIEADCAASYATFIGSYEGNAKVSITKAGVNFYAHGESIAAFGTNHGGYASVSTQYINIVLNMMADKMTGFGALNGKTDLCFRDSHLRIEANGQEAVAFGGVNDQTAIEIASADISVKLRSSFGKETLAPDDQIRIRNSRLRLVVNGQDIEREASVDYTS
ncbi:MAG: EAL domain-containing protein [Oscillospiraceae bacterium]|nr:EAL domain-containing protein [Oscillospiraceae bacterium]